MPEAYRVLARLPRGAVAEFPYFYRRSDFPRHAEYMLGSTVHFQPLINGYSDHIPADWRAERGAPQFLPHAGVVRYPRPHRRALCRVPPARLRSTQPRTRCSSACRPMPGSSARSCSRTTCGFTRSSTGPTDAPPQRAGPRRRGPAHGAAHLAARHESGRAVAPRQRRHGAHDLDRVVGGARRCRGRRWRSSTRRSSIPNTAPWPTPSRCSCRA